jgi:hypothetical protein
MNNQKVPLMSLKKAFGKQSYQVMDESYKISLLQNPLVNGLFAVGRSFVIVANTYNWDIELVTGDAKSLTDYSNDEIFMLQGKFVVNYGIPEHADFNFTAVKRFMEYSNSCPEEQRELIFASLLFHYLIYEIRNSKEYYFYFNMGLTKLMLWLSTLFISIFIAVIISIL